MGYETKFAKDIVSLFFLSGGKNEALHIEYDHQSHCAKLALYTHYSVKNRLSLWDRLLYVTRIILTGKPYGDQIVLNQKQLKDIKNFCSEVLS